VVLNFWAGLCPPCRAEMPDLQKFYDDYSDKVVLLGIDVGQFTSLGNRDDAQALLKELGVTYPAGFTEDPAIMRNFRVLGMPTTVFLDSEGETFRSWTGALNQKTLSEITDEMLAQ
ncbi:MAG: TlpA family protein disulfide reductase, partial [Dehalococcoidia bacterium]